MSNHIKTIVMAIIVITATIVMAFIPKPQVAQSSDFTSTIDKANVKIIREYEDTIVMANRGILSQKEFMFLVNKYAMKYNVSADLIKDISTCENKTHNIKKQSDIIYTFSNERLGIIKGDRERSFGLAQIHLPHHPNITYEQAIDPDFSLDFMAKKISQGWTKWSCYDIVTSK